MMPLALLTAFCSGAAPKGANNEPANARTDACVATGCDLTTGELLDVASRMWIEPA
jgi:hypothetical protein